MMELFGQLMQRVSDGNGFGLSLVGMTIVFSGLFSLFVSMLVLKKITDLVLYRKSKKIYSIKKAEILAEAMNMEEISAAIGLAFHFKNLGTRRHRITIKRLAKSSWKNSMRAKAMERL